MNDKLRGNGSGVNERDEFFLFDLKRLDALLGRERTLMEHLYNEFGYI